METEFQRWLFGLQRPGIIVEISGIVKRLKRSFSQCFEQNIMRQDRLGKGKPSSDWAWSTNYYLRQQRELPVNASFLPCWANTSNSHSKLLNFDHQGHITIATQEENDQEKIQPGWVRGMGQLFLSFLGLADPLGWHSEGALRSKHCVWVCAYVCARVSVSAPMRRTWMHYLI